ncbi:MAG: hypothetical protein ACRDI2_11955 [Chloroflexota bacterium]
MLPYYWAVDELLSRGRIPASGTLTGFASYAPPGIAWLLLPGAWAVDDPRLSEYVGATLLSVGTLVGVYCVGRIFGPWCAVLSVIVYGLSEVGLFFAWSLWPRAHPFFAIWTAYALHRWVQRREPQALALALLFWAVGMYAFLELAPMILVPLLLWLWYRPPVRLRPLVLVAIAVLVLWSPYLRFEASRGFLDLISQVGRQSILPADFRSAYCEPPIAIQRLEVAAPWLSVWLSNFSLVARIRGASAATLLLCVTGLIAAFRRTPALVLTVVLPWSVLLALTQADRPERFWWLWPLQTVFLASATTLPLRLRGIPVPAARLAAALAATGLICLVSLNPTVLSTVGRWMRSGWPHAEPDEVRVLDYIAAQVRSRGGDRVAIGYQTNIWEFMASYHVIDPRYKVGADLDYLLLRRHGIVNTNECAEGISALDEFRIVEQDSADAWRWGPDRFLASTEGLRADTRIGRFLVLRAE